MSFSVGVACAFAASALYSAEIAIQAMDARATPLRHALRPELLVLLARRPRWLTASAIGTLGWPLQAAALALAPLTLVQPALALGLLVLFPIARRVLRDTFATRDLVAAVAIAVGITGIAATTPARHLQHAAPHVTALVLAALGALALLPYAARPGVGRATARAATVSAGCAFAWSGIATKFFVDAFPSRPALAGLWLAATAVAAGVGVLSEMTALQVVRPTQVAPAVFAVETLLPVALAPVLVGERWSASLPRDLVLAGSIILVVAGAVLLQTSRSLEPLRASASSS